MKHILRQTSQGGPQLRFKFMGFLRFESWKTEERTNEFLETLDSGIESFGQTSREGPQEMYHVLEDIRFRFTRLNWL
ncbi:hypothetical protein QLX08_004758 [Tetragonisca angustula]|uniref:Uncharacterized protein n=1 Tax=Tetragonisca angustula TaxID=166442 RepID=A0AAW1A147_9HYME